jgi:hypothetical protein
LTSRDQDRRGKILSVIRVSSGNFLEMYDFFVFGYYAPAIGRVVFPLRSAFASLIQATQNKAMPGVWLAFAAACGLGATIAAGRGRAVGAANATARR